MKKYKAIFSVFFFLTTITSLAQWKAKNFIGFTSGLSSPVGDFSKADPGAFNNWNNSTGFAKTGFSVGVEGAYYFLPKIGLGGSIYYSEHGGFSKNDAAKLGDSYTDAFGVDQSTVSTTGSYRSLNVMVGPYFSFPLKKFTIDMRVMGGLLKSISTPVMTVELEDQTEATFKQLSSPASAFGWQVGAGFRYALTDKLGLTFRSDYFSSNGVSVENQNRANTAGRLVTRQPMAWVNSSVGISFSW